MLFYSTCFDRCGILEVITTRTIHASTIAAVMVPPTIANSSNINGMLAGFCMAVKNGGYNRISPCAICSIASITTPPHSMMFNQLIFNAAGIFFLNTVVMIPVAIGAKKHAIFFYLRSRFCFGLLMIKTSSHIKNTGRSITIPSSMLLLISPSVSILKNDPAS